MNSFKIELNALRDKDFHTDAYIGTLHDWIKSESVYTLLRYGAKSTTIIDGMDDHYVDMLNLSEELKRKEHQENELRKDDFEQRQP